MSRYLLPALVICIGTAQSVVAQSIHLREQDAEVWLAEQSVRGSASSPLTEGVLHVNEETIPFNVNLGRFGVDVHLEGGENVLVACDVGGTVCSDTLVWTLGFTPGPEVYAYASADGGSVMLHGQVIESPNGSVNTFEWIPDPSNPTNVSISGATDSVASVTFPPGSPAGEYYFSFVAIDDSSRTGRSETFVTVDSSGVRPFDIWNDHAAWVDRAIVYEVTPYIFEEHGTWRDVTQRLDEIATLGINTLWLQPVFKTHGGGQGYDITDYFELRTDLGTEADLRELVRSAKEDYGMRVLFDFVPNHTSIQHPYAQDAIEYGSTSHYEDFYQRTPDDAPYSQHYNVKEEGKMDFLYYFWDDLVNIDWSNPEVYAWMREAGQKWIEEFDIDGYRIDAVWGVNARTPAAMQKWRFDLKRIKPDIFLLGEDKATWPSSFEGRFDAAYDWYPGEEWVSSWTWLRDYSETGHPTIFNSGELENRSDLISDALTNRGSGWHQDAKVFRFMENNDTERFFPWHDLERTKMASIFLFSLPGIPMIYNGQEIGAESHPYDTFLIFEKGETIPEQDEYGLYEHYQHLTALRSSFPALISDTFQEIPVGPESVSGRAYAYRRWTPSSEIIGVLNTGSTSASLQLDLPVAGMNLTSEDTQVVTDLMTGDSRAYSREDLEELRVFVPGYSAKLLAIADHEVELPTSVDDPVPHPQVEYVLHQNYPNPFNQSTRISFEVATSQHVSLYVFDLLGRRVATLMDGTVMPGRHEVSFDANGLATGIYHYRLDLEDRSEAKQMLLIR